MCIRDRDHPDRFGKAERDTLLRQYGREPRGLVVAVKNASSVKWYNDDESPESGLPKTNRPSLCYKDISGLANSRHIEDTHGFSDYQMCIRDRGRFSRARPPP